MKAKAKEFINLKQGKMIVMDYALKFYQLFFYASKLVSFMRARMRKFSSGLSYDLVFECKAALLNGDMDISRFMVSMQLVNDEKKKQAKVEEWQNNRS